MAADIDAFFNDSFVKMMRQTITIDPGDTTPGLFKAALWDGSEVTPNFSGTNPAYGSDPWDAGEPIGSPGYDTGGEDLTVLSFAELVGTANKVGWRFATVLWTSATISADGVLIYAPDLSNRAFVFRTFGALKSSTNGDYELSWHADGAARWMLRNAA